MGTVIFRNGRIVLPAAIRKRDGIKPGQNFNIERIARGKYRLQRIEPAPNEGLIDWLLACPGKGFFVPPVPSTNPCKSKAL